MNRLPILLFGVISTLAVAFLLLFLYRYATQSGIEASRAARISEKGYSSSDLTKRNPLKWLDKLAKERKPDFSYPVSEMEIELPLKAPIKKRIYYRLLVKDLDPYKRFCLKQLLKREGVRYAMFRKKTEGVLVINDLNRKQLKKVIELIREYDVDIKIENYTKD